MTREEAIRYLIKPVATSTEIGEEKKKEFEAYNMAIEALLDMPVLEMNRTRAQYYKERQDMITISTELKPCPFCGGQPKTSVNYRQCGGGDLVLEFAITCSHCGVKRSVTKEVEDAPFDSYINMMDKAMELWNNRV